MNKRNNRESEAPCKRHKGPATKDDCDHCAFRTKIRRGGETRVVCGY